MMKSIPAYFIRGGTSKGLFFNANKIPSDISLRNKIFLKAIGSPDPYGEQMDGLGGGTSSTSKVVVVSQAVNKSQYDVQYLFGQVQIKNENVDYSGSCGNMVAGVGHFALAQKLIKNIQKQKGNQMIDIRILQKNINKKIIVSLQCDQNLVPISKGDFKLYGVSGSHAPIQINFIDPGDGQKSLIFPTGNRIDELSLYGKFKGRRIDASLVNVGNPTIFVRASQIGLKGTQNNIQDAELLQLLQNIRCVGSVKMGIGSTFQQVHTKLKTFPKISFVSKSQNYQTSQKTTILENQISLISRIISLGKMHHTFTVTGLLSLATASSVPGSIPSQFVKQKHEENFNFNIGHRGGITNIKGKVIKEDGIWRVLQNRIVSSSRILMKGEIYYQQ